jgi:acyl dehydratase
LIAGPLLHGARFEGIRLGPVTAAQARAFAAASGDGNAIHLDGETARRAGLRTPPVHGMLLVALIHQAVSERLGAAVITALSTRFLAPVPVGEAVDLSARMVKADPRGGILRILVRRTDGTLAVVGEAVLALAPAEMALP